MIYCNYLDVFVLFDQAEGTYTYIYIHFISQTDALKATLWVGV